MCVIHNESFLVLQCLVTEGGGVEPHSLTGRFAVSKAARSTGSTPSTEHHKFVMFLLISKISQKGDERGLFRVRFH